MSRSLKYLAEQEDLEDPPSLRPGAYDYNPANSNGFQLKTKSEPAPMLKKKSLFSSLKWGLGSSRQRTKEHERKYDSALYSFGKPSLNNNPGTLSSSNLEDLNSRLKTFKSSRTITSSNRHLEESYDEPASRQKIPPLFASHFTYSKADITELLSSYNHISTPSSPHHQSTVNDDKLLSMEEGGGNQNPLIQSLKAALKTMTSEIDSLEELCVDVEDSYMKATLQASVELQKSMNVLFQFQQNAQKLDDLKSQIQDTKEELKTVKHRLIEKEKERRQYKQQVENQELLLKQKTCEITELTKILGESSEDLAQMKIDAKYVNTVTVELNACKRKNKTLKDEVIRLRKMQDKNNASDAVVQDSINLSDEKYSDSVTMDSIVVSLDDLYQGMNVEQQDKSYKDIVSERDTLIATVAAHEKSLAERESDFLQQQEVLKSTQARLSELLEARMDNSTEEKSSDMQIQMAELHSERDQRQLIEAQLAEEKRQRIAAEEKFATADSEWKALITEVDLEMKSSHQVIESLQESKKQLSKEVERLKQEQGSGGMAVASAALVRDLENRLVQSCADTRRAHILIQEQKSTPGFSIRVFAYISDPLRQDSSVFVVPNSDQISLQLKDVDNESGGGNEKCVGKKFIFDKVFTPATQDKLLESLEEYVKHAVDGKQTSIISHGHTQGNKTELLFGSTSVGGSDHSVIQVALSRMAKQLLSLELEGGWAYEVQVSFVRILDEGILDLFCDSSDEDSKKTHDIKRTSDGSTIITNLEVLDLNIRNEPDVQSVINKVLVARHVYSESKSGSTAEDWRRDCIQSHFVLTVMIKGTHNETGQVVDGKLSFMELAGDDAEKDDRSAEDGTSTNKSKRSLQCFNDIITSISKRQGHIPYRNTKITYILQPSFSPSGKSLLIFGLNRDQSYGSAYKALQFANHVFQCTISPMINQSGGSSSNLGSGGGSASHLRSGGSVSRPRSVRGVSRLKDEKTRTKIKATPPLK